MMERKGMVATKGLSLLALFACGGCSLVYDTNGLRNFDGSTPDSGPADSATGDSATGDSATGDSAMGDSATGDSAMGDSATGDSAMGDAGCMGPIPDPVSISWDGHGMLTVAFDHMATRDVQYRLSLGADEQDFTLSESENSATLRYLVPLFRTTDTLEVSSADACPATTLSRTRMRPTFEYASASAPDRIVSHVPTMDIADDGTVVFVASSSMADGGLQDHLYRWPPVGDPTSLHDAPPGGAVTLSLFGPRISDDGNVITYWQGDFDAIGGDAGDQHFYVMDGVTIHEGKFSPGTDHVTTDVRSQGTGGPYGFVMSDKDGGIRYANFGLTDFPTTSLNLPNIRATGHGGVLGLDSAGTASIGYSVDPRTDGRPHVLVGATDNVLMECRVDAGKGLVTADDMGQVAFVGSCSGTGSQLYTGPGSALPTGHSIGTDIDGLLATSKHGEVFLLRKSASAGTAGGFWIYADAFPTPLLPLAYDAMAETAAPTWSTFFDGAALSPNGRWAVYGVQPAAGSPSSFFMVRVRVR